MPYPCRIMDILLTRTSGWRMFKDSRLCHQTTPRNDNEWTLPFVMISLSLPYRQVQCITDTWLYLQLYNIGNKAAGLATKLPLAGPSTHPQESTLCGIFLRAKNTWSTNPDVTLETGTDERWGSVNGGVCERGRGYNELSVFKLT